MSVEKDVIVSRTGSEGHSPTPVFDDVSRFAAQEIRIQELENSLGGVLELIEHIREGFEEAQKNPMFAQILKQFGIEF